MGWFIPSQNFMKIIKTYNNHLNLLPKTYINMIRGRKHKNHNPLTSSDIQNRMGRMKSVFLSLDNLNLANACSQATNLHLGTPKIPFSTLFSSQNMFRRVASETISPKIDF